MTLTNTVLSSLEEPLSAQIERLTSAYTWNGRNRNETKFSAVTLAKTAAIHSLSYSIYSNLGDIILCGDFNARTGNLKDFLENDDVQDLCINSCFNMAEELQVRNNRDIQISPFGRLLIETCISFNLAILNGRTGGDLSGQFTCYTHNGASTIDYAIVNKTLIQHIDHFTVHPPSFNSCHSPLSLVLKLSCDISKLDKNPNNLKDLPYSFKWDDVFRNRFIETLESTEFTTKY